MGEINDHLQPLKENEPLYTAENCLYDIMDRGKK